MTGVVICQCHGRGFFKNEDIGKLITYIRENHEIEYICEHPYLCSPKVGIPFLRSLLKNNKIVALACYQRAQKSLFNSCQGDLVEVNMRDMSLDDVIVEIKKNLPLRNDENLEEIHEWFPAIDYNRCNGCGECYDFCIFGVYEVDEKKREVKVAHPYNCKDNCPACARDCPQEAIIFAKATEKWVAGGEGEGSSEASVLSIKEFEYPGRTKKISNIPDMEDRQKIQELIMATNNVDCVESAALTILNKLNLSPKFLDYAIVELKTKMLNGELSKIPYDKRVLIIPHCLRDAEKCGNHYEPLETGLQLICEDCGSEKCKINPIVKVAKELGYDIYISEGATVVLKMLKEKKAKAFVAVACLDSLMKAIPIVDSLKIPGGGIPLLKGGCRNTDVDVDSAINLIKLKQVDQ